MFNQRLVLSHSVSACLVFFIFQVFLVFSALAQDDATAADAISTSEKKDVDRVAGESEKETLYISSPSQLIASNPGGRKLGELYINTPVRVLEEKGDWSRVSAEVWVRSKALTSKTRKKKKSKASSDFLQIQKYSTRVVKDGLPTPRVYLAVTIKNISKVFIRSWSALLVAQQGGSVLFREPLADDTKAINPGGTVELQFYWERGEKPFPFLENSQDGDLELAFYKTKVN
jgi:hypothetical protein